jgi:hypothetical protein
MVEENEPFGTAISHLTAQPLTLTIRVSQPATAFYPTSFPGYCKPGQMLYTTRLTGKERDGRNEGKPLNGIHD